MRLFGRNADWTCAKCRSINHPDAEFCEFCGHPKGKALALVKTPAYVSHSTGRALQCPICGAICEADDLFCGECGSSLKKPAPPTIPVQEIIPQAAKQEVLVACVHCGMLNLEQNRYCEHCSEELRVAKEPCATEEKSIVQEQSQEVNAIFCPECGARCSDTPTFCNECGARLTIER